MLNKPSFHISLKVFAKILTSPPNGGSHMSKTLSGSPLQINLRNICSPLELLKKKPLNILNCRNFSGA